MFMRYRGGGIGHLYMRAVEAWLSKTGWGGDITASTEAEEADVTEDQVEPVPDNADQESDTEPSEESEQEDERGSDADEDTVDGEYGFSGF